MHPDEIRVARRDVSLRKIMQRLPQPVAECEGERWTTVTHGLRGTRYLMLFSGLERRTVSQFAPDLLKVRQIIIDARQLTVEDNSARMTCRLDHGRGSSASVCELHCHEAGNRDGEVEWPDNRLQIGQATGERIERHDIAIARGGQGGEAEI